MRAATRKALRAARGRVRARLLGSRREFAAGAWYARRYREQRIKGPTLYLCLRAWVILVQLRRGIRITRTFVRVLEGPDAETRAAELRAEWIATNRAEHHHAWIAGALSSPSFLAFLLGARSIRVWGSCLVWEARPDPRRRRASLN